MMFTSGVMSKILKTGTRGDWSEYKEEKFDVINLDTLSIEQKKIATSSLKDLNAF